MRSRGAWCVPLVFVCAFLGLASGIRVGPPGDRPPFNVDEAHKLSESYYYHLFFEEGSWRHPDWRADFYARTNPPVAKYLFGAALAASGLHVRDRQLESDFDSLWATPDVLRSKVPDAMLQVTRRVSAVYGALTCALVFWIGQRAAGPVAGLLAALFLLANPYFVQNARSGLTDTILLFHLTLIVPVSLWSAGTLRECHGWGRNLAMTVLVPGLVVALATGSKLNGALTGPVYAGSLLLAAVVEPGASRRGRLIVASLVAVLLTAVVAVAVLVTLNPTLHDRPVGALLDSVVVFGDWMAKQQIEPGPALFDIRERAAFVGIHTVRSFGRLLPRVPGAIVSGLMVTGLSLGVIMLAASSLRPERGPDPAPAGRSRGGDAAAILCWSAGVVTAVTLWLPVAWSRYVLPAALPIAVMTAIGLATLPRLGRLTGGRARRMRPSSGPVTALAGTTMLVLSIVVMRVTDPAHLDPEAHPDIGRPDVRESYLDPANSRPWSAEWQQRVGRVYVMQGRSRDAADRFETALSLIPRDADDGSYGIRRAILLFDLARARASAGELTGALDALLEHLRALRRVRGGLQSGDASVLDAFDRLIAEREAMAHTLRARTQTP